MHTVNYYDSLSSRPKACVIHVCHSVEILCCLGHEFVLASIFSQQQSGGNDCGLLAIATANSLCHGELPDTTIIMGAKEDEILSTLLFENGKLIPFPGKKNPNSTEQRKKRIILLLLFATKGEDGSHMVCPMPGVVT